MQCSVCFSASSAAFPSLFLYQCLLWPLGRLQCAILTAFFPFPGLFLKKFLGIFLVVSMEISSNIWMHKHLMLVVYENLDCSCLLFFSLHAVVTHVFHILEAHSLQISFVPLFMKFGRRVQPKKLENCFYSFSFSDLRVTYFFVWI